MDIHETRTIRLQAFGFAVGSALFATGSLTSQFSPSSQAAANVQLAIGAVLFTFGAAMQLWLSRLHQAQDDVRVWQLRTEVRNPDLISSVVQLVGTLYFNVMTLRAVFEVYTDPVVANHEIWRPDLIGSALFLLSSAIAWAPVARHRRHNHVWHRSLWISRLNVAGSLAFGVAALGSRYVVDGQLLNPPLANWATFVGAVLFCIAAVLLLPRWAADSDEAGLPTART